MRRRISTLMLGVALGVVVTLALAPAIAQRSGRGAQSDPPAGDNPAMDNCGFSHFCRR